MDIGKLKGSIELDNSGFKRKLNQSEKQLNDFTKSSNKLNFSMRNIAAASMKASLAIGAIGTASAIAFRQFEKGAKLFDQHRVFDGLAANIGRDADAMVDELKQATKGAISEINAMAVSTQAIMSGMEFDDVTVALEYLQRYAKATDKSFQQLTSTIMTGLARGSVLMLDDAGIILDQASLVADAEAKVGHALSEVEKKQLLVNAAIEQMQRKLPALGGGMETVADKLQAMKTGLSDFKASMELKAFTIGMTGLKWITERFYDLIVVMADVRIGAEIMKNGFVNAIGDMVQAVNRKLMDAIIGMRNALSHSLAGLWDQDNPIANAMKASLDAAVKGLDGSLNVLFEVNQKFLDHEAGQNAKLETLYAARAEIIKDQAEWSKFFTVPEGKGGTAGRFDLSGTVGTSTGGKDKTSSSINPMAQALNDLQGQINQLSFEKSAVGVDGLKLAMREASFETERLREQYGTLAVENPAINQMIDQIRQLRVETAAAADDFQQSQAKFKLIGDVLGTAIENFTQPLANSLAELAKTGKMNLKDLAGSMVETLQVYAAEKTAHFLMEGTYRSLMAYVDSMNAAKWMAEAATAFQGAAIMGSFVAGSALAGMAHDGMSQIPEDGTWLLQKGERVVDRRTNEDLKQFLKGGTGTTINMPVTIQGGDEQSVLKALPALKQAAVDAVSASIASRGTVFKTIQTYRP